QIFGIPAVVPLMPMTSAAFIVFTLYMIPDPATTPLKPAHQVLFGVAVAAVYAVSQMMHLVFGLFFALVIVCAIRGAALHLTALLSNRPGLQAESAAAASRA
ncbi:MAG: enediyne biosynthesis protein UnbU, partial [Verrucomicrobia bacterium]|nr:enediyne biosynthesis protein UnbU [Verrucomicrobiota bacterium]